MRSPSFPTSTQVGTGAAATFVREVSALDDSGLPTTWRQTPGAPGGIALLDGDRGVTSDGTTTTVFRFGVDGSPPVVERTVTSPMVDAALLQFGTRAMLVNSRQHSLEVFE